MSASGGVVSPGADELDKSPVLAVLREGYDKLLAIVNDGASARQRDESARYLLYMCLCPVAGATVRALAEVLRWCETPVLRPVLVQQGAVETLAPLLTEERHNAEVTQLVTSVLEKIALEGEADVHEALEVAVAPLVGMLAHAHESTTGFDRSVLTAAAALRNMGRQPAMRALIVDEGALVPLLALCDDNDRDGNASDGIEDGASREEIVSELVAQLAAEKQCRPQMMRAGAAELLVKLCASGGGRASVVGANAAGGLVNLAKDKSNRQAIIDAGAVSPLVRLCAENSDMMARVNATQALAALSKLESARAAILREGAAAPLVAICHDCNERRVLRFAIALVATLGGEGATARRQLLPAAPSLVRLCRIDQNDGTPQEEEKPVIRLALEALAQLASDESCVTDVAAAGAVEIAVRHCARTDDATACANAAWAIAGLAAHSDSCAALVQHDAPTPLLAVMHSFSEPSVLRDCAQALLSFARGEDNVAPLVRAGAVEGLAQLVNATENNEVHTAASNALLHLSQHDGSLGTAAAQKTVAVPLLKLCTGVEDMDVLLAVTRVLRALVTHDTAVATDVAQLCAASEVHTRGNLLLSAMQALSCLATHDAVRGPLVRADIVGVLLDVMQKTKDKQIVMHIAVVLDNLALDQGSLEHLVQTRATELLTMVCDATKVSETLQKAAGALCNLAVADATRATMVEHGAVPPLADLCAFVLDEETLHAATKALGTLALGVNKDVERATAMVDGGAVRAQIKLCARFCVEKATGSVVLYNSLQVLRNLSAAKDVCKEVIEQGTAACLVALCGHCIESKYGEFNSDVLLAILEALCNLTAVDECRARMVAEKVIHPLVGMLRADNILQELARSDQLATALRCTTESLRNLARFAGCRTHIVDQHAVPALAALCEGADDDDTRAFAAGTLANLALEPSNAEAIMQQGALTPLVDLVATSSHPATCIGATAALRILARAPQQRLRLAEAGAVAAFVKQNERCTSSDADVLGYIAGGLVNLTLDEHSRPRVVEDGGVRLLIALCTRKLSAAVLSNAAAALANLALDEPARPLIVKEGVVHPMSKLCASIKDDTALSSIAGVLVNLTLHEPSRDTLVRSGVVKPLVALCCKSDDSRVLSNAAAALANLAFTDESRTMMVEQGAIKPLLHLCEGDVSGEDGPRMVVGNAAWALANIVQCEASAPKVIEYGGVRLLTTLCRSQTDKRVLTNAAKVLANLACHAQSRTSLVKEGAARPVVQLCAHSQGDIGVLRSASFALANFACNHASVPQIMEERAVSISMQLLANCRDLSVQRNVTWSLANIARDRLSVPELMEAGAFRPLITLCGRGTDSVLLSHAAQAIANLCLDKEAIIPVARHGAVRALVKLLCSRPKARTSTAGSSPRGGGAALASSPRADAVAVFDDGMVQLFESTLDALSNLACEEKIVPHMMQETIVPPVVNLCGETDMPRIHKNAALVLATLACHEPSIGALVKQGAARALVRMCKKGADPEVLRNASAALGNLARDSDVVILMLRDGVLQPLVHIIMSSTDPALLGYATEALGSIALAPPGRAPIVQAGALPGLIHIVTQSDDSTVLVNTAETIGNLALERSCREAILEIGGMQPLVQVCSSMQDNAVLAAAASALVNLRGADPRTAMRRR